MVALVVLAVGTGLALWTHERIDVASRTEVDCSSGSGDLAVWPESLTTFADRSYGVIVGTMLNSEDDLLKVDGYSTYQFRVTDVVKGRALYKGDILQLCGVAGPIDFVDANHTALIFLLGKNHNHWIPIQGEIGVIPQSEDGRFNRKWADDSKTSATVDELKKLIK